VSIERFHQTLKKHLAAFKPARTIEGLQRQLDDFMEYRNTIRPHRALGRRTPQAAFAAHTKARPSGQRFKVPPHCRVRQDKVHIGNITLRYRARSGRPARRRKGGVDPGGQP
jgi:hypothetical protein